jgi:hypothetical protein
MHFGDNEAAAFKASNWRRHRHRKLSPIPDSSVTVPSPAAPLVRQNGGDWLPRCRHQLLCISNYSAKRVQISFLIYHDYHTMKASIFRTNFHRGLFNRVNTKQSLKSTSKSVIRLQATPSHFINTSRRTFKSSRIFNMKEAIVAKGPKVTIHDVPIPKPNADQVLIKVIYSGSNPKDWKRPNYGEPHNSGDDIAGIVEEVGDNVVEFKKGDRVAAFHEMMSPSGSFAEYAIAWAYTTFHLPKNTSFEEVVLIQCSIDNQAYNSHRVPQSHLLL